jgi:hypothetical protein
MRNTDACIFGKLGCPSFQVFLRCPLRYPPGGTAAAFVLRLLFIHFFHLPRWYVPFAFAAFFGVGSSKKLRRGALHILFD